MHSLIWHILHKIHLAVRAIDIAELEYMSIEKSGLLKPVWNVKKYHYEFRPWRKRKPLTYSVAKICDLK